MALVLTALGTLGASSTQAHTQAQFHCDRESCVGTVKSDGSSTTAHHVFVLLNNVGESVSITCNTLSGEGSLISQTANELTVSQVQYSGCKFGGYPAEVRMNSCKYRFTASGEVTIEGCQAGKSIEVEVPETKCIVTIAAQGPLKGITYHSIGEKVKDTTEVTASAKVAGIAVTLDGSSGQCIIDPSKTPIKTEYTTGNTIISPETDPKDRATVKPDGTGATAHHVFVLRNSIGETVAFTCSAFSGEGASNVEEAEELTITNPVYSSCKASGQETIVRMNACYYFFTATGQVTIKGCAAGKLIELEILGTKCIATVPNQGPLSGVSYHSISSEGTDPTKLTASAKVAGIFTTLDSPSHGACLLDETKTPITSEYTTGNSIVTWEEDGTVANAWWTATVA